MKPRRAGTLRGRIRFVLFFFFLAIVLLIGRLFTLQIVHHRDYTKLAARQHRLVNELSPERGLIYAQDRSGEAIPLALNKIQKVLVASPRDVEDPVAASRFVAETFRVSESEMLAKLSQRDDPYEILVRPVETDFADQVKEKLPVGVFFEEERRRAYPHGKLAAHLLGFVSRETLEEEGKYGVERFYDRDLAGRKGFFEGVKDAAGSWVALGRQIVRPPKDGSAVVLTIDFNIQRKAEEVLEIVGERWGAASAAILVTEPSTGRILALARRPGFDPNEFGKENDLSVFLNPVVESMYEMGSVLKPISMAGALQEGVVTPLTTYEDPGEVRIGGRTIRNFDNRSHGVQTMSQVIEKSLNTGMVYVSRRLGPERHRRYLEAFGLGKKTGLDLPGEVPGNLSNLDAGREIDFATASFGQGIAVTPLQVAMAMGAVANDGKLMRPYIVEQIREESGNTRRTVPQVVREVISPATAETLTKILVSTVRSGFENRARVTGYFVAGKTGTAQIPRTDSAGYSDKVIHSFAGYAPAFEPRFLVLLQLVEPQGNRFAANTLTPAFHDLAEYMLNYYEIPPDEK